MKKLYVAGGLGYYMSIANACAVGLLPKDLQSKAEVVGNTSLAGVKACLIQDDSVLAVEKIANEMQIIELSFSQVFQDKYVENMFF